MKVDKWMKGTNKQKTKKQKKPKYQDFPFDQKEKQFFSSLEQPKTYFLVLLLVFLFFYCQRGRRGIQEKEQEGKKKKGNQLFFPIFSWKRKGKGKGVRRNKRARRKMDYFHFISFTNHQRKETRKHSSPTFLSRFIS